ncbi:hypothetical protein HYH02_007237 [Chlamydomonas schloesseri]|uniref:Uncharacterized protein n=1 Tax=Chlamydomonas schloesseri TaxID=2026947 RepID=A0A835WIX9_9CHLO|nr:hypothetical protein HYH02_007237 [Chlamydomonas schloesseri]|eukprot:KAG2447780.1 hypothetical protein HYH02_007237 [Chlamydomonas schloesseri]
MGAVGGNIAGVECLLRVCGLRLPLTPPHVLLTEEAMDAALQWLPESMEEFTGGTWAEVLSFWLDGSCHGFSFVKWVASWWWLDRLPPGKSLPAGVWRRMVKLARRGAFPPHQVAWFMAQELEAGKTQPPADAGGGWRRP